MENSGIPGSSFKYLGRGAQTGRTESDVELLKRWIYEDTVAMNHGTNRDHINTIPNLINKVAHDNNVTPFMMQQTVSQWQQDYQKQLDFQKQQSNMMSQFNA